MLFGIIKIPAQLSIKIFCRNISINNKELLSLKGPLLIAANHPNSFLDAIIIATLFKRPVYSLARGDAFKNKFISAILRLLNMLPVYRISEGQENIGHNYKTFDSCRDIFLQNGIVLIFSEGLCTNEWHLRPLKKGTARLATDSWATGIPLRVLPLGINYHSFTSFGKNVKLYFGNLITDDRFSRSDSFGNKINRFNSILQTELSQLVIEISGNDEEKKRKIFFIPQSFLKKVLLILPAITGWLIHVPFYLPIKFCLKKFTDPDVHYDSVLVGLTFILYPFYITLVCSLLYSFTGNWWSLASILALPFFAWSCVQLKKQFQA